MGASIRDLKNIVAAAHKSPPDNDRLQLWVCTESWFDWFAGRNDNECVMNELVSLKRSVRCLITWSG